MDVILSVPRATLIAGHTTTTGTAWTGRDSDARARVDQRDAEHDIGKYYAAPVSGERSVAKAG
jgi:hypothetical protein